MLREGNLTWPDEFGCIVDSDPAVRSVVGLGGAGHGEFSCGALKRRSFGRGVWSRLLLAVAREVLESECVGWVSCPSEFRAWCCVEVELLNLDVDVKLMPLPGSIDHHL